MRWSRAGGRDGLVEGTENQRAEEAMERVGEFESVPTCEQFIDF